MVKLLLAVLFLLLALAGVIVRKTYYHLPERELKRRAARRDREAEQLYRAVAYGNSAKTLLWLYIGLTSAASVVLFAKVLPIWVSLLIVGPLLWIVFSLIPATRVSSVGQQISLVATPVIAWLLNYLHPALSLGAHAVERRYVAGERSRLFEREDLLELIDQLQMQPDSRFTPEELEIARRALTFGDLTVNDVLIPRKNIKKLLATDTIGPILIDEVVKGGEPYAVVRDTKGGPFTGVLEVNHLGLNSSGKVRDAMKPTVYYLHENDTLGEALHAFSVTNFPVFLVVNSFEEYVGIISVEKMLEQLLGHIPGSDFDQYADPAAVAARHTRNDEPIGETGETPVKTEEEVVE